MSCTLFLLFLTFWVPIFQTYSNSHDPASKKVFIKFKASFCLFPENVVEGNQVEIGLEDCDKLVHDMENKAIWFSFSDNRLRTNNGLCLKPFKNFLVVSYCSPNANENSEVWKIDEEQRLQNENQDCAQIAGMKLFVFKCNKLSTTGFEFVKFSDKEMNLMKIRYAQNKLQTYNPERLQQLHDQSDSLIKHYVQVEKNVEQIKKKEVEMQKDKTRITHLMNEIKLLLHVSAFLKHFGTGAIMNIYDTLEIKNRKSIIKDVLQQLQLDQNMLFEMGVQKGKTKIVITSFINAPYEDHYTFTAKNIQGSLRILLDQEEIISNSKYNLENDNISSPLVFIPRNKLVPIYIEIASEQNLPSFTLFWSSKHLNEQVINSLYLYTTMYDKVCYTPIHKRVDCFATFESVSKGEKETNEFQTVCPSQCGSPDKFPVYKKKDTLCYEMNSSICGSAIHSNFITHEVGGIIKVQFKKEDENTICATVAPSVSVDSTFRGITDIKLIDIEDFFENFEQNKEQYQGFQGVVTDDTHSLLYKSDPTKSLIVDIDIDCKERHFSENNQKEQETGVGSFVIKRTQSSSTTNTDDESFVVDLFALFDNYANKTEKEQSIKDWNLPGWTRKSCNNIQLFIKYGKPSDVFQFPSLLLSCEDTFEDIHFEYNSTINVRCLPFCNNEKKVIGSFIYAPNSPVCKSAMHSGVISKEGGIVEITKMENISQAIPNTVHIVRNGIEALVNDTKNKYSFYVSKPKGIFCNFPRTSINVNEPLNAESEFFSFIETRSSATSSSSSSMQSPPVALVSMKHAVMKQQLSNLFNVYSTEEYKKGLQGKIPENGTKEKALETAKADILPNINIKEEENVNNTNFSIKEKQNSMKQLTTKTQSILTSLMKRNTNLNYLNQKLATYRIEQKNYDEFIKSNESIIVSLIKQFNLITIHKKNRIGVLERALRNVKPNSVETFQETYQSNNINNNYIIIDSIHSVHGTSNWKIEKFKSGQLFSAITNDSLITSDQNLFGSYILYRHTKMYKGFISVDFKIPYEGIMAVLFKYKDSNNYNSFIISRNEYYFIDVIEGKTSKPINKKLLDSSWHIGEWVHIFLDFGYKNVRAFINGKYACGYETQNSTNGYFGFGVNHSKEKVFIDKITIGSLEQARYFKGQSFGMDREQRSESINKKEDFTETQKDDFPKQEEKEEGEATTDHDIINSCKYFEEFFKEPLEHNWLIPMNAKWNVKSNHGISSMWNKTDQQEAYVHSKQINIKDTITPSILLLKKDKFCISMKSFTFQSAINVEPNSKIGVLFRVLNSLDFLSIIIDTSEFPGILYLLKTTNGTPYQLLIPTHIQIKSHEWYHLQIQFDGIQLQVMFNDEKVLNANLNEQSDETGNLGLVVLLGEGKFKDIRFEPKGT